MGNSFRTDSLETESAINSESETSASSGSKSVSKKSPSLAGARAALCCDRFRGRCLLSTPTLAYLRLHCHRISTFSGPRQGPPASPEGWLFVASKLVTGNHDRTPETGPWRSLGHSEARDSRAGKDGAAQSSQLTLPWLRGSSKSNGGSLWKTLK
ncbi:uncharacterized protein [Oryctolagus cuniculus]|uniref:uncharacterized protein n=1 Tax=Oryctolagus cuniculus TaxID=9986 RepID=UPI00222F663C|nr:uncharacterized protein LOC103352510 [Oryctolagus cuniculus]